MDANSNLKITGQLDIELRDEHGNVKERRQFKNLVVTVGKAWIAARIAAASTPDVNKLAVGTGSTAPSGADTALVAETARVTLDSATPSGTNIVFVGSLAAGVGTGALQEAGLFSQTAAVMLSRVTFPVINKAALDAMSVTWTVTVG